jgi:hypothetical protein
VLRSEVGLDRLRREAIAARETGDPAGSILEMFVEATSEQRASSELLAETIAELRGARPALSKAELAREIRTGLRQLGRALLVEDVTRKWLLIIVMLLVWSAVAFGVGWWFGGAGQGTVQLRAGALVFDAQGRAYIPVERQ